MTVSNFKFLLKQVANEILNCGDDDFIQKYLPSETVETIMRPEPLEDISSAFYLPRLNRRTETVSNDVEEKPTLSRRKSSSKQSITKQPAAESQLSTEELGYLMSQDDPNSWPNDEPPFDYSDEIFEAGSVARQTPGKRGKGKRKKSEEPAPNTEASSLIRLPSNVLPPEPWEQACLDMLKKLTRHEFLDLTKPNPKVFKADFFRPVVELFPELATEYLKEIRLNFSIFHFIIR